MFNKKKVLVIMPFYFKYQNQIKKHLIKRGAEVYLINEDVNELSFIYKFISIYFKRLYSLIVRQYYKHEFKKLPSQLDSILIIKGSSINQEEIIKLKKIYKNIKIIMYQWDSIAHYSRAEIVADWCDEKISFDPIDAQKNNWRYRPLFFDPDFCNKNKNRIYDISYICSIHSDRVRLFKLVLKYCKANHLNLYDYLYSNKWSFIRQKIFKKNKSFMINHNSVKFTPLSFEKTAIIYESSKCLLDYKFTNQVGLTIRSIESIGHNCKLITNNHQIINEDFFDPNNIYIYDVDNFIIPDSFFVNSYKPIPDDLYYKYSIDGWLDDVFRDNI